MATRHRILVGASDCVGFKATKSSSPITFLRASWFPCHDDTMIALSDDLLSDRVMLVYVF